MGKNRLLAQIPLEVKKNHSLFCLSLIVLFGFGLRVYGLDFPCLWLDELSTWYRIDGDLSHTFNTLKRSPFPPLYYIFMNIWSRCFGFSETALRLPSVFFSTAAIIAVYYLAKTLFGEKEGLIAALLLSVSSYALNYAQEAKMYAMLWFFIILAMRSFFLYIHTLQKKHLILYAIFSVVTVYTLYLGFIFLFVHNVLFCWLSRKRVRSWILAHIFILLAYIPWWFLAIDNMSKRTGITWIQTADYGNFFKKLFEYLSGIRIGGAFPGEFWILAFLMVFAVIFSIYRAGKGNHGALNRNYAVLLAWPALCLFFLILIDHAFTPILVIRYLGFLHIPLIILFAVGITAFTHFRFHRIGYLLIIYLTITALLCHVLPFHQKGLKIHREHWTELIAQLCHLADDDSIVVVDRGLKAMNYYGQCYHGDVVFLPALKFSKNDLDEKLPPGASNRSIWVLYRGKRYQHDDWKSKWFLENQGLVIKIGYLGLIRLDPPPS